MQIEGLVIDENISMADLKGTLEMMMKKVFLSLCCCFPLALAAQRVVVPANMEWSDDGTYGPRDVAFTIYPHHVPLVINAYSGTYDAQEHDAFIIESIAPIAGYVSPPPGLRPVCRSLAKLFR